MNSTIVKSQEKPRQGEFTFPGLFRSHATGSVWLAHSAELAVRLVAGRSTPDMEITPDMEMDVGDIIRECDGDGSITPEGFTQIDGSITIQFSP